MPIFDVTGSNFDYEVLGSSEPVLVDVWAPWCAPCRIMVKPLTELDSEGTIRVVKLNADKYGSLAAQYGVSSIPTMMLFKDGKNIGSLVGAKPKAQVERWIEETLSALTA